MNEDYKNLNEDYKNPLQRDGIIQTRRLLNALKANNISIDGRNVSDLKKFAEGFAKLIHYFDKTNEIDEGWVPFFRQSVSETAPPVSESTPHYALFLAFLELFGYAQDHINSLIKKHLDFYYNEVLRIKEKLEKPDQAHIIFELAKNIQSHKLKADNLLFKAGKDDTAKELFYKLNKDIVINKAQIKSLKTVFVDKPNQHKIFAAPVANSADGLGKPLEGEEPKWYAFGKSQYEKIPKADQEEERVILPLDERTMQDADLGFAIASPILLLHEGDRSITLILEVEETKSVKNEGVENEATLETADLNNVFRLYLSSEDEWIEKLKLDVKMTGEKYIQIKVVADAMDPPIVAYNKENLGGDFKTNWPILKLMVNPGYYHLLGSLRAVEATLIVEVENIYSNILESDRSTLDPGKPFQPFGPIPIAGSEFYIGNQEVFQKKLDSLSINIEWVNVPDFESHYAEYDKAYTIDDFTSDLNILKDKNWLSLGTVPLFNSSKTGKDKDHTVQLKGIRFETFRGEGDHPYYFRLIDDTGRIVLRSEGYLHKAGRDHGIEAVRENSSIDEQYFRKVATNGKYFFSLIAANREIIGVSQFFKEETGRDEAIELVKQIAPEALIEVSQDIWANTDDADSGIVRIDLGEIKDFPRDAEMPEITTFDRSVPRGFFKLSLNSSFGHQEFPILNSQRAINKALETGNTTLPNEPYTPTIKSLSLNYSSSETFSFLVLSDKKLIEKVLEELFDKELIEEALKKSIAKELSERILINRDLFKDLVKVDFKNRVDQFFHIEPFGAAERHPYIILDTKKFLLLPQYSDQGSLYIGIEYLGPPKVLNILFQVAEGTADPDIEFDINSLKWSYLSNNLWIPFDNLHILSDTTQGIQTSGIIAFDIPKHATADNTIMPANIHWLRATIENNPESLCQLIELRTQVATVSFIDKGNDPGHLEQPLKADTISKLAVKDAAIKSISQPYASFGGTSAEQDNALYARVSERLRHKNRAITIWDYERLVLEKFPSVYKVRCLNHTDKNSELAPGAVTMIVIQNLRNKNAVNPLQPKTSRNTLMDIKKYLQGFISPFVDLVVQNPVYEEVLADFTVGFKEGVDSGYHGQQLNKEIKKFLSPWAFEEVGDIVLTGKIHKSTILKFIEDKDYVDFVSQFRLYHIKSVKHIGAGIGLMAISEEQGFIVSMEESEVVEASNSRSVLVSAQDHNISVMKAGDISCTGGELGIGHMMIDVNFEVN